MLVGARPPHHLVCGSKRAVGPLKHVLDRDSKFKLVYRAAQVRISHPHHAVDLGRGEMHAHRLKGGLKLVVRDAPTLCGARKNRQRPGRHSSSAR